MRKGAHQIAKIKMKSVGIGASVCVASTFYLFCNSVTALNNWICLALLIVECMVLIRRPRSLFQKRLNDYFVIIHFPFCKWNQIYQFSAHRYRSIKRGEKNCKMIFRSLTLQMKNMFSPSFFPTGYYRTITHDTVKARIEQWEKRGHLTILTCKPIYSKNLARIQETALHRNCRRCSHADRCQFRRYAMQPRQFYYIEFHVHIA
jgi:hypothetical protein